MNKINIGKDLYLRGRIGWKGLNKDEYLERSDYKIINATALMDGYVDWENCGFITKERYEESEEIMLQEGDILISKDGTIGKIGYVKGLTTPCTVASGIFVLRNTNPEVINFDYLYHVLKSPIFKRFIAKNKVLGSTIPHLYQRDLEKFEINLPSIDMQKKIAHILSAIDEQILNNDNQIRVLEATARTIYDYWFKQFDFPDDHGKPYRSNGGKMEYNKELRKNIPAGWDITNIGSITICHDSERIPISGKERAKISGDIPYYGATCIMDYVDKAIFSGDFVLVAEDGSVMDPKGHPIIQRISGDSWVNNHAHVLEPNGGYTCRLLMLILGDMPVAKIKTGSIQMKINQKKLNAYKILDIPKSLLEKVSDLLEPIDKEVLLLQQDTISLMTLRNWLLPALINGRVKIIDESQ